MSDKYEKKNLFVKWGSFSYETLTVTLGTFYGLSKLSEKIGSQVPLSERSRLLIIIIVTFILAIIYILSSHGS